MAGPWDKYKQTAPAQAGPWSKYAEPVRPPIAGGEGVPMSQEQRTAHAAEIQQPEYLAPWLPFLGEIPTNKAAVDKSLGELAASTQGAARSVADTVGGIPDMLLVNPVNAVLDYAGVDNIVNVGGENGFKIDRLANQSDALADLATAGAEAVGVPVADPAEMAPNELEAYKASRLASGFAMGAPVATGARALVGAADNMPGIVGDTVRALDSNSAIYRDAPIKALAGDAAAGMGAATANEAMDDVGADNPWLRFLGTMAGAAGGNAAVNMPVAAARGARDAATSVSDTMRQVDIGEGESVSRRVFNQAGQDLQDLSVNPEQAALNLNANARYLADNELARPSNELLTDDKGLIALGKSFRQQSPNRAEFLRRDQAVDDSTTEAVRRLRAEEGDPSVVRKRFAGIAEDSTRGLREQVDAADKLASQASEAESALTSRVNPSMTPDAASEALDATVRGTMDEMGKIKRKKFEQIDPDGTVQVDPRGLIGVAEEAENSVPVGAPKGEVLPKEWIASIKGLLGEGDAVEVPEMTFKDAQSLRPLLSKEIQKARQNGDVAKADVLESFRAEIGSMADDMAVRNDPAGTRAKEAVSFYKDEYAPRFANGTGGKFREDIRRDVMGTRTRPTDTARRFLSSKEAATDLQNILSASTDAVSGNKAAREYLLNDVAKMIGTDGKISPKRLRDWRSTRAGVIDQVPGFGKEMDDLIRDVVNAREKSNTTAAQLKAAAKALDLTEREVQKSVTGMFLKAEPEEVAADIIKGKDSVRRMREVMQKIGNDKEAVEGWKAAVSDYLYNDLIKEGASAKGANVDLTRLTKQFRQNEKVLAQVYGDKEMEALRAVQKAMSLQANRSLPGRLSVNNADDAEKLLDILELPIRYKYGILAGGGVVAMIRRTMRRVPGLDNREARKQLIEKAFTSDPALLDHLLKVPSAGAKPEAVTRWNKKLAAYVSAQNTAETSSDDEE